MREIAIFDLDDTLLRRQSQKIIIKELLKKKLISPFLFLRVLFWLFLYRSRLIKTPKKVMERGFSFLKGRDVKYLEGLFDELFEKEIKNYFYKDVLDTLKEHKNKGRAIILISNSVELVVKRVCQFVGADFFLATKLEIKGGKFTGKIEDGIMYGKNKVEAIKKLTQENNLSLENSWAYSDHESDIPLFETVANPVVINPRAGFKKEAEKRGWPVLVLKI